MKTMLKIIPLEERIVLDAALGSAMAQDFAASSSSAAHNIIYVDAHATPGGDGTSWKHAYSSLQDALTKAASTSAPEQIWIAEGNYTPSKVYDPNGVTGGASGLNTAQLQTFNLPSNVTLIGGFVSGDKSINQSNPLLHQTILNGSLGNGTDVWHVVTAGNDISKTGITATLTNLTIENGLANGPDAVTATGGLIYSHESGGGIYEAWGSNLTLNNVTLLNDSAALAASQGIPPPAGGGSGLVPGGGGISVIDSTLTVNNSTFSHDVAGIATTAYGDGGAIFGFDSSITINKSSFFNNSAASSGGAVAVESSSLLTIDKSIFTGNSTTNPPTPNFAGGAGVQVFNTDLILTNSVFTNNNASYESGGLLIQFQADAAYGGHHVLVQNDTFTGNTAVYESGAITVTSQGNASTSDLVTIDNSKFLNNFSGGTAGAVDVDSINVNITNSQFIGNYSAGSAGALNTDNFFNSFLGTPFTTVNVSNSTFLNNTAEGSVTALANFVGLFSSDAFGAQLSPGGGAIESMWGGKLNVSDSVFIGNKALNGDGGAVLNGGGYVYINIGQPQLLIVGTGSDLTMTNNIFLGNSAVNGNGGVAANIANYGPNGSAGLAVPHLTINDSSLVLNSASKDGGAVYMKDTVTNLNGNSFAFNTASVGRQVWGLNSIINGEATSSPTAELDLALANTFVLLHDGDIVLN